MGKKISSAVACIIGIWLVGPANAADVTAEDVINHCYYKNQGHDQKTILAIKVKNPDGNENVTEYIRLWKSYADESGDLDEKMILFTTSPPENKGVNFMRWAYKTGTNKIPEQWVYLPDLRKTRRVSQRDPHDMTWGLTDEDFRTHLIDEDKHTLVSTEKEGSATVYNVESRPKGTSAYSRWVSKYVTPDNWDNCSRIEVKYYDLNDKLLKRVSYKWTRKGDVWVWDDVTIENNNTLTTVTYKTVEAAVNVGLEDKDFTERELQRTGGH